MQVLLLSFFPRDTSPSSHNYNLLYYDNSTESSVLKRKPFCEPGNETAEDVSEETSRWTSDVHFPRCSGPNRASIDGSMKSEQEAVSQNSLFQPLFFNSVGQEIAATVSRRGWKEGECRPVRSTNRGSIGYIKLDEPVRATRFQRERLVTYECGLGKHSGDKMARTLDIGLRKEKRDARAGGWRDVVGAG